MAHNSKHDRALRAFVRGQRRLRHLHLPGSLDVDADIAAGGSRANPKSSFTL